MKLTEKSQEVLDFVKAHGGRASMSEIVEATGRTSRSIVPSVSDLCKDTKLLAKREYEGEGKEKVCYVVLTEAGMNFVPTEDEE